MRGGAEIEIEIEIEKVLLGLGRLQVLSYTMFAV